MFNKWLDTFTQEKGIDYEEGFGFTDDDGFNSMQYGVVIEAFKLANTEDQKQLKKALVRLDVGNADIRHFLRAMAVPAKKILSGY